MYNTQTNNTTNKQTQQHNNKTNANNHANANTPTNKKDRDNNTDLMVREAARASQATGADAAPNAQRLGAGVGVSSVAKVFEPGELKKTDAPLDIAIRGDGFIEVSMPDGSSGYIRGGSLKVGKDGLLTGPADQPLKPQIAIPDNAQSLVIAPDGRVLVTVPNQTAPIEAGRIDVVRFTNPAMLAPQGDNLYRATEGSGEPTLARPGEDGTGTLAQGFLEGSNVKMVDEMVNLMLAQRAYEASVKVVQAADEMLGLVNNLRK